MQIRQRLRRKKFQQPEEEKDREESKEKKGMNVEKKTATNIIIRK